MPSLVEYISGYKNFNTTLNAHSIEDYIAKFNAYFPDNEFQVDPKKKLDPAAIETEKKISCTAAAILLALFVSDIFPNAVITFFRDLDNYNHMVLKVDFEDEERFFSWTKIMKLHETNKEKVPERAEIDYTVNSLLLKKGVSYSIKFYELMRKQ